MSKVMTKISSFFVGVLVGAAGIAHAESLPKLYLATPSYEFRDLFLSSDQRSDLIGIYETHIKDDSGYSQVTTTASRGRRSCTKSINWNAGDVVFRDGKMVWAIGRFAQRCGSNPPTYGFTNELPSDKHQQAFGPVPATPTEKTWEGKQVAGTKNFAFATRTMIRYINQPSSLYYNHFLRYAIGGNDTEALTPTRFPLGLKCEDFSVSGNPLWALSTQDPADRRFAQNAKRIFGKPLICQGSAALWLGDRRGLDITPILAPGKISQAYHYRVELKGEAEIK